MRELSLFTGAGGGVLGTTLIGFHHVGYVENNPYCQKILSNRIQDGFLTNAPIFGDIRTFISDGYAASYKGMVDVITAGFPCQPYSQIGKHKGEADPRNLWPETIETIKIIRPKQVLLENTKGLITKGYIITIIADLIAAGFTVWPLLQLGADSCGARHKRDRIWVYAEYNRWRCCCGVDFDEGCGRYGCPNCHGENNTYSTGERLERWLYRLEERQAAPFTVSGLVQDTAWLDVSNPRAHGGFNGLADRLERTRAIGNGQVPSVVKAAWDFFTYDPAAD